MTVEVGVITLVVALAHLARAIGAFLSSRADHSAGRGRFLTTWSEGLSRAAGDDLHPFPPSTLHRDLQVVPRDHFGSRFHLLQANRCLVGEPIRGDHIELPLAHVSVVGAVIRDRMVGEDIDVGRTTTLRQRRPFDTLLIPCLLWYSEGGWHDLLWCGPCLSCSRLLNLKTTTRRHVFKIPATPPGRAQSPLGSERHTNDDLGY